MNHLGAQLLLSAIVGGLLAALYVTALWWSLRGLSRASSPALWILTTAGARLILVVAGFWVLTRGQPLSLAAAVVGFIVARTLLVGSAKRRLAPEESARRVGSPTR